ncbi:MAG TPA: hypothetical protein PK052_01040 [Anaerohalosphaeraceae bacterium]|nr:hypothetical protein [Phycisphaerae bacterium]HOK97003.1 hypothetical protein [Anaerohalosphaeraceae bacterium]HOL30542.1 hypothetical protein [Anaerohalosphaeraceae bacterium]HOM75206.1 hypothetical protein [Anaerohalosphaeraceae bacterium]HPC64000.1 hypothetical protein [Anaerohalosphaeraceae bacterium]
MRLCAKLTAWISLIVLVAPAVLFLANAITLETAKNVMLWATFVWFIAAPLAMWKENGGKGD